MPQQNKKILHIVFSLLNGGKENMLIDVVNEQKKMGYQVAVAIINKEVDHTILKRCLPNIQIFTFERNVSSLDLLPFLKLYYILFFKFKPDVIHAHEPSLGKIIKWCFLKTKFITIHGMGLELSQLKHFDKIIAISKAVSNEIETKTGLKSLVLYNGIYTQNIKVSEHKFNSPIKIVCVKRINHPRTGQDVLLDAVEVLLKNKNVFNVKVDCIGDGPTIEQLQLLINSKGLTNSFKLLGNKNREWVYSNLHAYDIYVQPSRFEGFGLSIVEAMAAGIPVVSSNTGGPTEILEQGKWGSLFNNGDPQDLAEKLEVLIASLKLPEIEERTKQAQKYCQANFNIQKTAESYCEAYFSVN